MMLSRTLRTAASLFVAWTVQEAAGATLAAAFPSYEPLWAPDPALVSGRSPAVGEELGNGAMPDDQDTDRRALSIARACAEVAPYHGVGVHGTALVYEKASIDIPAAARSRGEGGPLAGAGDHYRLVAIPESPPMDRRVPNGMNILVDTRTGHCEILPMR
jgi:hypothetical protein